MVVTGIFHSEVEEEQAIRLVGADCDQIFHEKVGQNETILSIRARNLRQAKVFSSLLSWAGAQEVGIDADAA